MASPHIVLLSFPGKGHINPFMLLARELASLGMAVTLVTPSKSVVSMLASSPESRGINLVALPTSAPDLTRHITMEGIRRPLRNHTEPLKVEESFRRLLEEMMASSSPPLAVVVDLLLHSASPIVDELEIPRYVFYTAAASHLAIALFFKGGLTVEEKAKMECEDAVMVPGLPKLRWCEISSDMKDETDPFFVPAEDAQRHLLDARGILMNTSYAIEGKVIDALREVHSHTSFLPIGPLGMKKIGALKSEVESRCKEWLDSQDSGTVLFISFGSWAGLGKTQIRELALGLEATEFPFLWLLPIDEEAESLESTLPHGFLTRTQERGLVLTRWAPQQLILSHASLGAFVTHCGWNSVTECISLGGLPMLGWPFLADQPAICKYLVEELRIAIGIVEDEDGIARAPEVERAMREVMADQGLRKRARKLKDRVRDEAQSGNASRRTLEEFVQCLKQSCA